MPRFFGIFHVLAVEEPHHDNTTHKHVALISEVAMGGLHNLEAKLKAQGALVDVRVAADVDRSTARFLLGYLLCPSETKFR